MLKEFDYSPAMAEALRSIDRETFCGITLSPEELIEKLKASPAYSVFVDYLDEKPTGYITLLSVRTLHYDAVWIDLMAVLPAFQSKGIAQRMIAEAKHRIRTKFPSAEFVSALVRTTNAASLGALKHAGFSADGKGAFELLFLESD